MTAGQIIAMATDAFAIFGVQLARDHEMDSDIPGQLSRTWAGSVLGADVRVMWSEVDANMCGAGWGVYVDARLDVDDEINEAAKLAVSGYGPTLMDAEAIVRRRLAAIQAPIAALLEVVDDAA